MTFEEWFETARPTFPNPRGVVDPYMRAAWDAAWDEAVAAERRRCIEAVCGDCRAGNSPRWRPKSGLWVHDPCETFCRASALHGAPKEKD